MGLGCRICGVVNLAVRVVNTGSVWQERLHQAQPYSFMWCLRATERLGLLCETCSAESGVLVCNACPAGVRPDVQSQALTETERNQHHDSKSIEVQFFLTIIGQKKKSLKDTPSLVSL